MLAWSFLVKYATDRDGQIGGLTQETEIAFLNYECKGKVREFEKIIRRAVIMSEEPFFRPQDLQPEIEPGKFLGNAKVTENKLNLAMARNISDKRTISRALNQTEGNISLVAKLLDVSIPTLYS